MNKRVWTDARKAELLILWLDPSYPARAIAEKLGGGLTRNAVIGKANRMGLPHKLTGKARLTPRVLVPTEIGPPEAREMQVVRSCQWPFGDPTAADYRLCGEETKEGKSYCAVHCKMAYVPVSRVRASADMQSNDPQRPSYRMRKSKFS